MPLAEWPRAPGWRGWVYSVAQDGVVLHPARLRNARLAQWWLAARAFACAQPGRAVARARLPSFLATLRARWRHAPALPLPGRKSAWALHGAGALPCGLQGNAKSFGTGVARRHGRRDRRCRWPGAGAALCALPVRLAGLGGGGFGDAGAMQGQSWPAPGGESLRGQVSYIQTRICSLNLSVDSALKPPRIRAHINPSAVGPSACPR